MNEFHEVTGTDEFSPCARRRFDIYHAVRNLRKKCAGDTAALADVETLVNYLLDFGAVNYDPDNPNLSRQTGRSRQL